ncbi:MAG TPA: hypothetical protein PLJ47_16565 [Candidatus Hydrogenedentes bacterium]|nr:hypothetical protein [Candidatus Hydrogenedentota bacterium]HRK36211.1 hypothetical protein [Candidatus Hydrogenedentota bacterium]
MRTVLACFVVFAASAGADNLLANPSFETVANNLPASWKFYVQPRDGAAAEIDYRIAKDGTNAVRLSIATPYPEDPANNWSQNLIGDFRGKKLVVRGAIKTENAGEAAIWVQCYQKSPLTVALQQSTALDKLVTGTQDWTPVEITVNTPLNTDFVVVRCVLRWRGTAWFDALSAELIEDDSAATPSADATLPKMPAPPSMPALPEMPAVTSPNNAVTPDAKVILEAHEALRKANEELRKSNAAMSQQLEDLRKQIEELKTQVSNTSDAAAQLQNDIKPMEREEPVKVPPPPLVPGDDDGAE